MSKKLFTRLTSLGLITALGLSVLSGCTAQQNDQPKETTSQTAKTDATKTNDDSKAAPSADEPGWKSDTSPVTFDWYVNFSWYKYNWGETLISKYIEEKTGVSINFIIPAGNENEKLNTMIAANSLPDIVSLGWYEEGVKKLIEGELVYPLTDLADQYDPYFYKVASEGILGWYQQPDGKTYGYPNFSLAPGDYDKVEKVLSNQTFEVRKDMYEAIGSPDMRTPEGFLNALKAAKEKFPEVNGQPLIPLGLHEFTDVGNDSLDNYLQNFLAIPREKNGEVYDRREDPEYVRWLKTLRKANEMGLISKDIFIDKRAQMEEKIAQGRYFSMLYQRTDMVAGQQALWAQDPNMAYMAVDGPSNSKLDPHRLAGPGISGWTLSMITKNAKNPDRAIKFFSYWISPEGQKDFYLGKKGETWDTIDGKDTYLPQYADMKASNKDEFDNVVGQDPLWMLGNDTMQAQWAPPTAEPLRQLEEWTIGKAVSYSQFDNIEPPADSEEGIIKKKVDDKWSQALPKLILAPTEEEFDEIYNQFITERNELGFDKYQAYRKIKYEENKKKLGIN